MLAELVQFSEKVTVIMRSGLQFMDFGLTLDPRKETPGEFVLQASRCGLARLEKDERADRWVHPGNPTQGLKPKLSVPMDKSTRLLNECWLPVPYFRVGAPGEAPFAPGPTTWARARIAALEPGEDLHQHTHRLTVALDTHVFPGVGDVAYLAPTAADVKVGAGFRLAHRAHQMGWFAEEVWVAEWIEEVFRDLAPTRLRLAGEDLADAIRDLYHHAHYLNWLALIGARALLPEVVVISNATDDVLTPIPVDMVLDVGNSRTCGILIEDHPQQGHGLKNRYELALRDLSAPHRLYTEPFESRVEFAQAVLGKEQIACKSGRDDAFVWPTIARVGPEASRLANHRRGTEGSTGISSPKRYLWDEERYQPGWRFNVSATREVVERNATGAPFSSIVNELGEALYTLDESDRIAVFMPHYSRSALMTFMLAEVLSQALIQINSPAQRLKQGDPEKPRHLRSIILTVPPSMPKPERDIFAERVSQAVVLVWKALGWHPEDDDVDDLSTSTAWPPFPLIRIDLDEATCAQVVYVFSESQEHFGGRPEDFFRALRRPHSRSAEDRITIGSIDIGGGTTDLVVTDYSLEGTGANVFIRPEQRFRDGFRIAGDDLVLEMIQKVLVPAIEDALTRHGVRDPMPLLSKLIGSEALSVQDSALRQQFSLQILYPLGLRILKRYEQYDPIARGPLTERSFAELLAECDPPSEAVRRYFASGVAESGAPGGFDILGVPVQLDMDGLHNLFLQDQIEIAKTIRALCEIVHLYDCDVLLLSGRPSCLPGVQALFRALLPLPPDRIVPLHGYRAGTWYPFHRDGRIADPKTTAAVGAMLCKVGGERKIPNFNLLANAFKPYSTVRYIGLLDHNSIIKEEDVYYRDVRLDDEEYELPEQPVEMRGRMVLGFRQLANPRWGASPLYVLDFANDEVRKKLAASDLHVPGVVHVTLRRERKGERFEVVSANSEQVPQLKRRDVTIRLNTLNTVSKMENSYWLDTGGVIR